MQPGISRDGRSAAPRGGGRPAGYDSRRTSAAPRSGGQRPSSGQRRPAGSQPPRRTGGQPPRRTPPRRRRSSRAPLIAALAAVLVIVALIVIVNPFGKPKKDPVADAVPASNPVQPVQQPAQQAEQVEQAANEGSLQDKLADYDSNVGSLSADQMAVVNDLSINTSLPDEWLNILLLGTDERTLSDSARTDAMIICSINRKTGEVKLSSIMRDLAIEFTDIGQWNGTYRINAANYFGGPNLAMKTVNEKFKMNIQNYVMVNFFGFQKIAQRLGGVDMDITKEEMDKINIMIVQQAKFAYQEGIDESDQENVYLETYGENTHLNGRQTLAYARIRKLTGGDAMRTERQRKVLQKLMEKVRKLDAIQLASLASEMIGQVKTNLPLEDIVTIALRVSGNGLSNIESMHLPVSGTYKEEVRKEQSMLYDCDFDANATQLYNFIYY